MDRVKDCINPEVQKEPGLLNGGEHYSPHSAGAGRRSGGSGAGASALLGFVTALSIALLGVVIWLGVEHHRQGNQLSAIQSSMGFASTGDQAGDTAVNTYPSVYLSQTAASPPGYTYESSLFRGSGFWSPQSDIVSARGDLGAVAFNDKIYIVGGQDVSSTILDTITAYDTILEEDANLTSLPQPRSRFAIATNNATIYVMGGYASAADKTSGSPQGCALAYDVAGNSWVQGACMSTPRADACAAVVEGKVYVAGGVGAGGNALDSVEVYDSAANSWSASGTLPFPITDAACAVLNDTLIAIAGGTFANGTESAQMQAFNPNGGSFTQLASLPSARYGLALVQLPSGRVLAVGGGVRANGTQVGAHDVEEYDFTQDVWVVKAPIGSQRFGFGAAYLDEGVYVVGGTFFCPSPADTSCSNSVLSSVEVFYDSAHPAVYVHTRDPNAQPSSALTPNASQVLLLGTANAVPGYSNQGSVSTGGGYWTAGPQMPASLSDMSIVSYGYQLYIIGGIENTAQVAVDTLYSYDPVQQAFQTLAPMPQVNCRGGAAVLNGRIYVTSGFTSASDDALPVDTTMIYDIATNTWSFDTSRVATARSDCCMVAVDGMLYLTGGYSAGYNATLSSTEVYDPNTRSWAPAPDMPTPRGDVMCESFGDAFVAVGGFYDPTGEFASNAQRNEVQQFSPATGIWTDLAPLPVSRDDMAMASMPGQRLLVMGGETNLGTARSQIATHQVWEYLGQQDAWVAKAPMTTSRFRFNAAFNGEAVWAFGGQSSAICPASGDGLQDCTKRPLDTSEAFYDASADDVFIYVQSE